MKANYVCEVCGKMFATPEEANACEKAHSSAKQREEQEKKSASAISSLIDKHIEVFGTFPELKLSRKSVDVIEQNARDTIDDIFDTWVGKIFRI